jgi:hypothetical protein
VDDTNTKCKNQKDLILAVNRLVVTDTKKLDCSSSVCDTIAETVLEPDVKDEDTSVWRILEFSQSLRPFAGTQHL